MLPASPIPLSCRRCGSTRTVANYDPSLRYRCLEHDCGGELADPADAKTVRTDTPAEVSKAAADPRNVLGKYILLRELGRGGMGAVYKAWDSTLKRWVALKFLLLPGTDEDLQRFRREAQTAAALKHPNIAAIYEVGESEGKPFLAMEFVEGRSLQGLKLKVPRACKIMRQVSLALAAAHGRSIIHRDLKPGNILLDADDKPTVLDFGLAKSLGDATQLTLSGMVVGTPCYMSPEQARGRGAEVGPRSDVYQLGAVLYELVTGRPPFRGDNAAQILLRVVEEDLIAPSRLAAVPSDVETIILRAMEKDPAQRYPSAKAFALDLDRFLRGEEIVARRASPFSRIKRSLRRHKPATAATLAAIVILLVGIGWVARRAVARDDHMRQGDLEFDQRKYQSALESYSRALELDPDNVDLRLKLDGCREQLRLAVDKGRIAEKAANDQRALAAAREAARPSFERGHGELEEADKDLYRQGTDLVKTRARLVRAIESFTESLSKWPDNPDALFSRGRARVLRFDLDEADRDFARAIEIRPEFPAARTERGKLLLQRYIEARIHAGWQWSDEVARPFLRWKDLARTVSADDAWTSFAEDRMLDCRRICERRLAEKQEQEELWKLRGDTFFLGAGMVSDDRPSADQETLLRSAVESYSEAIRLRPNYYEARTMRGYVQKKRGDPKSALEDFAVALRLRPDDSLTCCLMSHAAGGPAQALEWLDRGLKTYPDSFICRMNRGTVLFQLDRTEEAKVDLERSMSLNPGHYYPFYLRGALRFKSGNYESAFQDFQKVVELEPRFHSGWFNLGLAAYRSRHWQDAITAMERASRMGYPERATIEEVLLQSRKELGK